MTTNKETIHNAINAEVGKPKRSQIQTSLLTMICINYGNRHCEVESRIAASEISTKIFAKPAGRTKIVRTRSSKQRFIQKLFLGQESVMKKENLQSTQAHAHHEPSDLTPEEQDTVQKSKESCSMITASGVNHYDRRSNCPSQRFGHVYHNPIIGGPAVLSVGKIMRIKSVFPCVKGGRQSPILTKHGKIISCKSNNVVPRVVPEVSVETSPRSDADGASGDRRPKRKIFHTGFNHLVKDSWKENLDHPAVLVTRFRKHLLHKFQSKPGNLH